MDIDYLIDRLEALIRNGKRVPLTGNKVMVDEQECFDLIDQMRVTVPEEVKVAKRTLLDRERILNDAEEEAHQIIERADRERQIMLEEKGLMAEAERQRDVIVSAATEESYEMRAQAQALYDEAVTQAQEMRENANLYAMQVLQEMEGLLGKHLGMVQNGLKSFRQQADDYQKQMNQYHDQYKPQFAAPEKQIAPATNNINRPAMSPAKPAAPETANRRPATTANTPPRTGTGAPVNNGPRATPANSAGNYNRSGVRPFPKPANQRDDQDEDN